MARPYTIILGILKKQRDLHLYWEQIYLLWCGFFETCVTFRPASTGLDQAFVVVTKMIINFDSWSHEQYISYRSFILCVSMR